MGTYQAPIVELQILASACGLWLHPSSASRVGYARQSLATLAFNPQVTPHYLCLSCESKSELSILLMQAQSLDTLAFASLCLISLQGLSFINILVNSIIHPRTRAKQGCTASPPSYLCITLCYYFYLSTSHLIYKHICLNKNLVISTIYSPKHLLSLASTAHPCIQYLLSHYPLGEAPSLCSNLSL